MLVHLSSAVQQPTGAVMPVGAARRLARAAEGWRAVVIDDRSRAMLQFRGDPPPPLASFVARDGAARIVTVGSLSRVGWPGLRIGWLRADRPSAIDRLVRLRAADDLGPSIPSQLLALRLLDALPDLAARRRELLTRRYHNLVHLVGTHLQGFDIEEPRGGWIVPVRLPAGRASRLAVIARSAGVEVLPASIAAVGEVPDDRLLLTLGVADDVQADVSRGSNGHGCSTRTNCATGRRPGGARTWPVDDTSRRRHGPAAGAPAADVTGRPPTAVPCPPRPWSEGPSVRRPGPAVLVLAGCVAPSSDEVDSANEALDDGVQASGVLDGAGQQQRRSGRRLRGLRPADGLDEDVCFVVRIDADDRRGRGEPGRTGRGTRPGRSGRLRNLRRRDRGAVVTVRQGGEEMRAVGVVWTWNDG